MPSLPLSKSQSVTLELVVRNHPGVMSHVCGLFSRRAFNLEGIICLPAGEDGTSRMWLHVADDDDRLDQIVKQVGKLEDVRVIRRKGPDGEDMAKVGAFFSGK